MAQHWHSSLTIPGNAASHTRPAWPSRVKVSLAKSRGIKIIKELAAGLPSIKADSIQLEQVFINLINNARDALDGCKDRIIEVSTQKQDGHILVEFRDSGKGIAPESNPTSVSSSRSPHQSF